MGPLTDHLDLQPFFVLGLPRSRTKWLSQFLAYGGWVVHHDIPLTAEDLGDMRRTLAEPCTGSVDTGLARALPMLLDWFPRAKVVVVLRPAAEVHASAAAVGWTIPTDYLEAEHERLVRISAQPGVLTVTFDELRTENACRRVFEHCLELPFDSYWWGLFAAANLQIDMGERFRHIAANEARILALFDQINGYVTYQAEGFESVYRDGKELFALHVAEADNGADPNFDLTRAAAAAGSLMIFTARTPAEMLGYLVFIVSPSFSNYHDIEALQGPFFVRKEKRGRIGLRLHEFARDQLKKRGVTKLALKAGIHASGPKFHRFYESIGAEPVGTLYSLSLKD